MNLFNIVEEILKLSDKDKVIYAEDIKNIIKNSSYSNSFEAIKYELIRLGYSINYGSKKKNGK